MLKGASTILRPWRDSDLEFFAGLRNDVELQAQLMTQPRPNSVPRVREWLQLRSGQEDGLFFVIADAADGEPVGYVQVQNLRLLHRSGELGICLAPAMQGRGHGGEALALLERYLQDTFALRKLVLQVLDDNAGAIRFYERNGFTHAGRLNKHFYLNGVYCDVRIMEKLFVQ
ncbi:MAG: family N-acetyltransferase [Moraxellaceae bacterium]|jgi:RimJ/RimL family protein N-acetyltransferase|nr:family N-acetyltransferase [Moraxellaceae bacterium]